MKYPLGMGVDVFMVLQEEEPEMFERQPSPGGATS